MSKPKDKETVIQHKKASIRTLNNLLEGYISSGNVDSLKKVDLISYWLESFATYIRAEDSFDSSRLLRYSRGNIIRANFGFNIGKELGGLHFAVVIDNDNKRNADVITVIPLSSSKGNPVHPRSIDLGSELHDKILASQTKLYQVNVDKLNELKRTLAALKSTAELFTQMKASSNDFSDELKQKLEDAIHYHLECTKKEQELKKSIAVCNRNFDEIAKMKVGSIAVVNQITTISKQRIYTPKRSEDFLYGITLSDTAMDKINDKLKELFLH